MARDYIMKLTPGEKHMLRRRRDGLNQAERAALLGVSLSGYSLLERDLAPDTLLAKVLTPDLGKLQDHERALMYRRRAGKTQAEVAAGLEHCRFSVQKMENGEADCTDLLAYWEN